MNKKMMLFDGSEKFHTARFDTSYTGSYSKKAEAVDALSENIQKMTELQDRLYAQNQEALLIIFQAMDSAGKDGAVKHVMSGLNPQGTQVFSFKQPSKEELDHDYLWRYQKCMPERGRIGIFNRSYYEEVLVVRLHHLHEHGVLPKRLLTGDFWDNRYRQIRDYERYLTENGITILKFFLDISKEEQKQRFLSRIDDPAKNWKFASSDIAERQYWGDYMHLYEEAINRTSTPYAPWHVIPSDKKWFSRLAVSEFIVEALERLDPQYPKLPKEERLKLAECRDKLMQEP